MIARELRRMGGGVQIESFRTQATYIVTLAWAVGGLLLSLALADLAPWHALALALVAAASALLFLDWRPSPAQLLPPRVTCANVVGRFAASKTPALRTLVLMAHYDTAPISLLYKRKAVRNFARSLKITLGVLATAPVVLAAHAVAPGIATNVARALLFAYFVGQLIVASLDRFRLGFANGANDNGSGVTAALAVADRLRSTRPDDLEIVVVLTSAEEVGMVGSRAFFRQHARVLPRDTTVIVNFDTVANGLPGYIGRTGMVSKNSYDNAITKAAAAEASDASIALNRGYETLANVDTVWFARAGYECITFTCYDAEGLLPNIHRPEDDMSNIREDVLAQVIDLGVRTVQRRLGFTG